MPRELGKTETYRVGRPTFEGPMAARRTTKAKGGATDGDLVRFPPVPRVPSFDRIRRVVRAWVQRQKKMKLVRFANGIRGELQTQDDLGDYDYAFDVFPRRGRAPSTMPRR